MARIANIDGVAAKPIDSGWEVAPSQPDAWASPARIDSHASWIAATVPGTVAGALSAAGAFDLATPEPLEDRDWWFRARIEGRGRKKLRFEGLATIAEVWLDDTRLLTSQSMYVVNEVEATLSGAHTLYIVCRALAPRFALPAKRARWRPRLASPQGLRSFRTTLLGHMNGWCPPVHAIGPWRPVTMTDIDAGPRVVSVDLRPRLDDRCGVLDATIDCRGFDDATISLCCGEIEGALDRIAPGRYAGRVSINDVRLWWPQTHGEPFLYEVRARLGAQEFALGRTGFRKIEIDRGADGKGFAFKVNSEPIFCRGALWTPSDLISLPGSRAAYEPILRLMRDAHMNMVRVGGTMVYETAAFHDLCDELGILVWQDFMFSNFDYPAHDPDFVALVEREATGFLDRVQASPSLALVCGASEVMQQAAMLGLPAGAWSNALFDETLARVVKHKILDIAYIPHTPFGGDLPFEPSQGVCHYYGVSAYKRPIDDARSAHVRFAAECLGFANPPDAPVPLEEGRAAIVQPCWGERFDRDVGATWYFEDVRNHYLTSLYGVDPEELRRLDPARYLDLSRAINAELMESVFALWRRAGSPTAGGLVWFLRDVIFGAGFGIIDAHGRPKSAWYALRRAFRPVQVLLVDEGLNGVHVHLINERSTPVDATLSLVCLRDGATPVMRAARALTLAPRATLPIAATDLWGAFFDTGYAYRFGPPSHDVVIARLADVSGAILAEAFHFPLGRGGDQYALGLNTKLERDERGWSLAVETARFAQSVHVVDDGFRAEDNWFHLAPGEPRHIRLIAVCDGNATPRGAVMAVNGLDAAAYGAAA